MAEYTYLGTQHLGGDVYAHAFEKSGEGGVYFVHFHHPPKSGMSRALTAVDGPGGRETGSIKHAPSELQEAAHQAHYWYENAYPFKCGEPAMIVTAPGPEPGQRSTLLTAPGPEPGQRSTLLTAPRQGAKLGRALQEHRDRQAAYQRGNTEGLETERRKATQREWATSRWELNKERWAEHDKLQRDGVERSEREGRSSLGAGEQSEWSKLMRRH